MARVAQRPHLEGVAVRHTCQLCGKRYVVEILARDCEKKHLEE